MSLSAIIDRRDAYKRGEMAQDYLSSQTGTLLRNQIFEETKDRWNDDQKKQ